MKKFLLYIIIMACSSTAALAQPPGGGKGEAIEKLLAFEMVKRLNLSVDESQKFFPVFNKYCGDWKAAVKDYKDDEIKRTEAILNVQKKYKPDFQRVLASEDRANNVFRIHREFIERLKNVRERAQERRQNNPRIERRGAQLF